MQATTQVIESLLLETLASNRDLDISENGLGFHGLYHISHPVKEDLELIQAKAVVKDIMPDLLVWEQLDEKNIRAGYMTLGGYLDSVKLMQVSYAYLANMTDEEMVLVRRQLEHIDRHHRVACAQAMSDKLCLYIDVKGTHYALTINVMNLAVN
ncbi:hypothetical protein AVT69_gp319 [Pseudomonas phage PhiPA3]|uniref:Uncharacterized protein 321 n=1 Tax=Pseudomonas phage PhiPA3 TaxID=998086 RepID=F8SJF7_BPPA3|nr:hypothetical protein AVT69_gp319 [Pseudomonas phage PhiPA3]AEH03744.1 hypothetical protein [Pseudomonas phage PhiPA3]